MKEETDQTAPRHASLCRVPLGRLTQNRNVGMPSSRQYGKTAGLVFVRCYLCQWAEFEALEPSLLMTASRRPGRLGWKAPWRWAWAGQYIGMGVLVVASAIAALAQTDGDADRFLNVVTGGDRLLGATIVSGRGADLAYQIVVALDAGIGSPGRRAAR
jgi:hypothetical protein